MRSAALLLALSGCDAVLRLQQVSVPDARVIDAAPDGLLAYYPFEDDQCATDVIGGHDGTCSAAVLPRLAGPAGHGMAVAFDGLSWITVPHAAAFDVTAGFTIAAWVAPTQYNRDGSYSCMVNRPVGVAGNDSWQICGRGTDSLFVFGDQSPSEVPFVTSAWTHVALTWDGTTEIPWINGAAVDQKTASQPVYDAQPIWFGADNDSGPIAQYEGALDEVRLYNRALAAEEIIQLAQ